MLIKKIIALYFENHIKHINKLHGKREEILGVLEKLRKATITTAMSICPSVCPHGTTRLPLENFPRNLVFEN
jgi:hypothetical protein